MDVLKDLIEIAVLFWLLYKVLRFLTKKDKHYKKSILGKLSLLLFRRIHAVLDGMIVNQKQTLTQNTEGKEIEFKVYRRKV